MAEEAGSPKKEEGEKPEEETGGAVPQRLFEEGCSGLKCLHLQGERRFVQAVGSASFVFNGPTTSFQEWLCCLGEGLLPSNVSCGPAAACCGEDSRGCKACCFAFLDVLVWSLRLARVSGAEVHCCCFQATGCPAPL